MGAIRTAPTVRDTLPATEQLLVAGGDARIALNPDGLNKYGCPPFPDPALVALGSSTASGISAQGFAAADRLRGKLVQALGAESEAIVYAREVGRIRLELARLCGISGLPGTELVFAASGTDAHLIAAQLVGADAAVPILAIMVEAAESGSGVPAALAGRHFSSRAALGDDVVADMPIMDAPPLKGGRVEVATVPIRLADGSPRHPADVDAEFAALTDSALAQGRRVLLVLTDVAKTGMIAPSPACALALHRSRPDRVDVLVDACQFRIAPTTLCAYLERGFMVALTGSKFVTGPPFSGALLIPAPTAGRLRMQPLSPALSAYSSRADWPESWGSDGLPANGVNFGLLLRWEAALEELRAFRAVPEAAIEAFLREFARIVRDRLLNDPLFELLPVPALERRPLAAGTGWDHVQTIFPFLLLHPETRLPLTPGQTREAYQLLQLDLARHERADLGAVAALRCQFGQPVSCGTRQNVPISALRLCASARLVVAATAQGGLNATAVINRALAALDKAASLVRSGQIKSGL